MAFTSFRAGSGDYQAVRLLQINPSSVPPGNVSVESFSVAQGNIASGGGSIADITTDSMAEAQWAAPKGLSVLGLTIIGVAVTATGELSLTTYNPTGSTISPAAGTQLNIIVF